MKKRVLIILCVCGIMTSLYACGGDDEEKAIVGTTVDISSEKEGTTFEEITTQQQGTTQNEIAEQSTTKDIDEEIGSKEEEMSSLYEEWLNELATSTDFDFSEYERHGNFSEGLAWVCKSDYKGRKYSYINENGEIIFELEDDVSKCYDYQKGIGIVVYEGRGVNNAVVFYDTDGNEIDRITDSAAALPTIKYFNNGNIFIRYAGERYMYINSEAGYIRKAEVGLGEECGDYSGGLLYSGDCFSTTAARGCYVCFFDEYGNMVLDLSRETGEYYKAVYSATDFKNGKSQIIFKGLDDKRYTVEIDTKGNWLGEPQEVDEKYRVRNKADEEETTAKEEISDSNGIVIINGTSILEQCGKAIEWLKEQKLDAYNIIHIEDIVGTGLQQECYERLSDEIQNSNWNMIWESCAAGEKETAKEIMGAILNQYEKGEFNIIFVDNEDMAHGVVEVLETEGIQYGVGKDVIVLAIGNR